MANRENHYWRRAFWAFVGVAVLGFGSAVLRVAQVGVDPYTAANIGISNTIGLDLGTYQLISNAVLLIPILLFGRMYIGIGSVINMVMTGYFIQWFSAFLTPLVPGEPTRLEQTVMFLIGITLFAAGASMYMTAALGNSPYDAIAPIIVDHRRLPYRVVRVAQDLTFVALALAFHGQVGIGTVMTAFFAGPLIDFFTEKVNKPLMKKDLEALSAFQERVATTRWHF
ncbi:YczE/YyaS/YitT family protein [Mycolicibacterium wolinskyi]|uniref:YczE/YyaS/YitT family protein n=1 Tax=Mycolicibacterium wolinskyi TaxID=59750 RepID=UPI0039176FD9